MDGESFDRLSVVVHHLREKATRRGALGLLLGGSAAAATGLLANDAAARNRHRHRNKRKKTNNCRGFGGQCWSNKDCCNSQCRSGRCWYGDGGVGNHCGGRICDADWGCCTSNGISVCVPHNFPTCCGNHGFASGYTCCGDVGGACLGGLETCTGQFGVCCQQGWKHCNNGFYGSTCIPNWWDCDRFYNQSSQSAGFTTESAEEIPTSDPITVPAEDWIQLAQE